MFWSKLAYVMLLVTVVSVSVVQTRIWPRHKSQALQKFCHTVIMKNLLQKNTMAGPELR